MPAVIKSYQGLITSTSPTLNPVHFAHQSSALPLKRPALALFLFAPSLADFIFFFFALFFLTLTVASSTNLKCIYFFKIQIEFVTVQQFLIQFFENIFYCRNQNIFEYSCTFFFKSYSVFQKPNKAKLTLLRWIHNS